MKTKEIFRAIRDKKYLWLRRGHQILMFFPMRCDIDSSAVIGRAKLHGEVKEVWAYESELHQECPPMESILDVVWLFKHLIEDWRVNFHPDDDMTTYVQTGITYRVPTWPKYLAQHLNSAIAQSFEICGKVNDGFIYQVGMWISGWDKEDADDSVTAVFGRLMLQEIVKADFPTTSKQTINTQQ